MAVLEYVSDEEYQAFKRRERERREREKAQAPVADPHWRTAQAQLAIGAGTEQRSPTPIPATAPPPNAWQQAAQLAAERERRRLGADMGAPEQSPPRYPGALQSVLGDLGKAAGGVNEGLRQNLPGYAGLADVAGTAFNAYTENIAPQAEVVYGDVLRRGLNPRAIVRDIPLGAAAIPKRLGQSVVQGLGTLATEAVQKGPGSAWEQARQRWNESPEPLPGVKGALEMTVPSELALGALGPGQIKSGVQLAARGAKAAAPKLAEAARAVDRAVTSPALREAIPRLGIEAVGETPNAPTFYSALERTINSPKAPNRAPAEQWRGILNSQGVKHDEVKWTGVDDFLNERRGKPVTKAELQEWMDGNRVEVREVTKGGAVQTELENTEREFRRLAMQNGWSNTAANDLALDIARGDKSPDELPNALRGSGQDLRASYLARGSEQSVPTKFAEYQLPGGENYRELLITLPTKQGDIVQPVVKNYGTESIPIWTVLDQNGRNLGQYGGDKAAADRHLAAITTEHRVPVTPLYQSPHYSEPNVLAHVRFNDRVAANGKKTLFLEEIQSDWHQTGRQKGYQQTEPIVGQTFQIERSGQPMSVRRIEPHPDTPMGWIPVEAQDGRQFYVDAAELRQGVPAAPFAKTWPELTLKRMIRYASENGYDEIAWTTGRQQVDRYPEMMRQVVDSIAWNTTEEGQSLVRLTKDGDELARLVTDQNGMVMSADGSGSTAFVGHSLEDILGKHIAGQVQTPGMSSLAGDGITIGGKGMEGFYDTILPEVANKLGKKFGARVGKTVITDARPITKALDEQGALDAVRRGETIYAGRAQTPVTTEAQVLDLAPRTLLTSGTKTSTPLASVHSLTITPAMKTAAMKEGFPLFSAPEAGGAILGGLVTPEDPNATPQENLLRRLGGAAVGAASGYGARRLGMKSGLGGTVEDAGGTVIPLRASVARDAANPNFQRWFTGSQVIDEAGLPKPVFRGDYRADLLGSKLDKKRATSGRFYFTEDPTVAGNYSVGKPDLALIEKNADYEAWFKFPPDKGARTPNNLRSQWYRLTPEEQARVKDVMLKTGLDDANNFDFSGANPLVGTDHWAYEVRKAQGNWLEAAKETWLNSGSLFNDEERFVDILEHAGLRPKFDSPHIERPGVTPVYLNIRRALDTSALPQEVVDRLRAVAKADRTRGPQFKLDMWDKNTNAKVFMERLEKDLQEGTTYAWTSVPEKITQELQRLGYDGIKDVGGKMGGKEHAVWIAFEPEQIKSALGNKGTFNPADANMLRSAPEAGGAILGGLVYQDDPNLSPEENLARRAAWIAAGGIAGYGARRLGMKSGIGGTVEDASKYADDALERLNKINARKADIEAQLLESNATKGTRTGGTIQRPPMVGSLQNAQLEQIAKDHGLNPYETAWWESLDPEALKEIGPGQRSGKSTAQALSGTDLKALDQELAALTKEADALNSQFDLGYLKALRKDNPRTPLWQGKTAAEPPLRGGPPAPPDVPGELPSLPSGRAPKGGQPLPPTTDPYEQLVSALTPTKTAPREAVRQASDKFLRAMYDRKWDAHTLEDASGIPVHKIAQLVSGSSVKGEYLAETQVLPVIQSVGNDAKYLEQYMVASRLEDILARNPHARLPEKIPGWAGALDAMKGLKGEVLRQKNGTERWQRIESAAKAIWGEPGKPETGLNYQLVLKPRLDAGMLNNEQVRDIVSANPHYISFYREDFAGGLQTGLSKGEASVSNAGLQQMDLEGSYRKLDNPLARFNASVINTQHLISENGAARAVVESLTEMEKIGGTKGAATSPLETGERFIRILRPGEKAENSNIWGTISYLDDGKKVTAQVPAVIANMAKGLETESANIYSRVARIASAPLRAGAVAFNTAFLPKNVIRDAISMWYREGITPLSVDYIKGWIGAITKNADYANAANAGALMSGIVENMRDTGALARASRLGAITVHNPKDALLLVPRLIQRANIISEQAPRIATYRRLTGQGIGELEAAVRARDVSVDFAKAGNVMKVINQAFPFTNAGVQGAANTLRTMRYNPKQAMLAATPLATASILAFTWNQRFETAKMVPEREYANNWVFIVGEGQKAVNPKYPNKPAERFPIYVRIPKGQIGALLTAPIEMGIRFAWANNDRSILNELGDAGWTMGRSLSPVETDITSIAPPLGSTFLSIRDNYDAFRDQPIIPRAEKDKPAELQYGPETSRLAVGVAELAKQYNVSPRVVDWAITDSLAGVGRQGLWTADLVLGALGYNPIVPGESKRQPLSEPQKLAKNPWAGGFLGTQNSEQRNQGWDAFDKAVLESQRAMASLPELRQLGIGLGPVSDSLPIGDYRIVLEPGERAELQKAVTAFSLEAAKQTTLAPSWSKAPDALKAKVLQQQIDKAREIAKQVFASKLPREELNTRIKESYPTAIGQ